VAGTSGAGKTTLAARIGGILQIGHTEIDALFHGPDWVPRPSFRADVERLAAGPEWVTEWQYDAVRGLLADRADLLVWLDLPRRTVMRQVMARTLGRKWR
jgi:adenylate kinase family enzyme